MHRTLRTALAVVLLAAAPAFGPVAAPAHATNPDGTTGLEIVGWGESYEGQTAPPPLPAGTEVVDVVGGLGWSAALLSDGHVVTWGTDRNSPANFEPPDLDDLVFTDIAAGYADIAGVTEDGHVVTWGMATATGYFRSPPPELADAVVTDVAIGWTHLVVLTDQGEVFAWSRETSPKIDVPASLADETVVQLSATLDSTLALTADGDIVQWPSRSMDPPQAPAGSRYVEVSAGYPNLARTDTGRVVEWGATSELRDPMPATLAGENVVAISSSSSQMALTDAGEVFSWGNTRWAPTTVPVQVQGRTARAIGATTGGALLAVLDGAFAQRTATVTGTPAVGETLTVSSSSSPTATTTDVQWLRDGVAIADATSPSYVVGTADIGSRLTARVTLHRTKYDDGTVTSAPTDLVPPLTMPGTASVTSAGPAVVGSVLTASLTESGLPESRTVTWSWQRDGVTLPGDGSTHPVVLADRGHRLTAVATVAATNYATRTVAGAASAVVRMPARTFRVDTDRDRVRRGGTLLVTASGLAAGEDYTVVVGGRRTVSGAAGPQGRLSRRVTVPTTTPLGSQRVVVTGWQSDRVGRHGVQVLRR